ncbi:hypothetical protein FN846DRAFT_501819 [Sphaerosporella brunnea]|uniref:F-box domain-containing protein n=1 Tax=Sphaerosporella brunnea TaxID=1250544 RepID=A0A5J5EER4_9PEZI|nr:hypothetical protein FN846DRAFT_501819 [Sphaerosporella brunnea]
MSVLPVSVSREILAPPPPPKIVLAMHNKPQPSNVDIQLCTPPCLHAPSGLLDTILLDVLLLLPYDDLLAARAVNRHWHTFITTRRLLRARCFLSPPAKGLPFDGAWELHPVLGKMEYWGYRLHVSGPPPEPVEGRVTFRGRGLGGEYVAQLMASRPAVGTIGVWVAGGIHWMVCEEGVSVWGLMRGFDEV